MYALLDITSRRIMQGGLVAFALFIPFSIAGENIAIGFIALAWILSTVAARIAPPGVRQTQPPIVRDPLFLASVLLAASAIPSVLISDNSERAIGDWQSYWQLLIYFAVASHLVATGMRETVLRVLAVSSILSCLVAFTQRAGGVDFGFIHIGAQHRVSSTLYTMTFAGVLFQLIVFYAAAVLSKGMRGRERALYVVAIACQFAALLLTMTRGAWLAVVAGLILLCILIRNRAVILAGAALLVLLVVFSSLYSRDQGRTLSLKSIMGSTPDRNVYTRLVLWEVAWDLFRENPVLGVGMGDYEAEATRLAEGREIRTAIDAHNIPLHILATRGLVGFLPFLFYWFTVFRVLAQMCRTTIPWSRARQYALGGIAVAAAILVGALTENNIDDEEVFATFMLVLGLARSEWYRPVGTAEPQSDE